jgi:WD40 repeat protein
MQQACAQQLCRHPLGKIRSIMSDFVPALLPRATDMALPGGHVQSVKSLAFVPARSWLLSGGGDGNIAIWDLRKAKVVARLKGHQTRIWDISATDRIAAGAAGDGTFKLWDLGALNLIATFSGHQRDVYSVDIDRGRRKIVSGGFDRKLCFWDVTNPQSPVQTIEQHKAAITSVTFD